MTFQEFTELDKYTRADTTLEEGVVIGEIERYGDPVRLYSLYDFYVELTFLAADPGEVLAIRQSEDDRILQPFLEAIDISELL